MTRFFPPLLREQEFRRFWFGQTISAFGFATDEDVWREDISGLGNVELRNLVKHEAAVNSPLETNAERIRPPWPD